MMEDVIKNVFLFDFISGMSIGIEFHTGEALDPPDIFAMTLDLLIIRVTYIRTKGNQYD